jgi:hypothetical protein
MCGICNRVDEKNLYSDIKEKNLIRWVNFGRPRGSRFDIQVQYTEEGLLQIVSVLASL